jgi:hypothetical protein
MNQRCEHFSRRRDFDKFDMPEGWPSRERTSGCHIAIREAARGWARGRSSLATAAWAAIRASKTTARSRALRGQSRVGSIAKATAVRERPSVRGAPSVKQSRVVPTEPRVAPQTQAKLLHQERGQAAGAPARAKPPEVRRESAGMARLLQAVAPKKSGAGPGVCSGCRQQAPSGGGRNALHIRRVGGATRHHAGRCAYCGSNDRIEADHRTPLCRGGLNEISNILPACRHCNRRKHRRTEEEFRALLQSERRANLLAG